MSDLEFQRALTPDQMREALSLLDAAARAKLRNVRVGDLNPAEEVGPGADHASTTTAPPNRLLAAEDGHQRKKHLTLVLVFSGLRIADALVMERTRAYTVRPTRDCWRTAAEPTASAAGKKGLFRPPPCQPPLCPQSPSVSAK